RIPMQFALFILACLGTLVGAAILLVGGASLMWKGYAATPDEAAALRRLGLGASMLLASVLVFSGTTLLRYEPVTESPATVAQEMAIAPARGPGPRATTAQEIATAPAQGPGSKATTGGHSMQVVHPEPAALRSSPATRGGSSSSEGFSGGVDEIPVFL